MTNGDQQEVSDAAQNDNAEGASAPDLEEIATKLTHLVEDHKLDQIENQLMHSWYNRAKTEEDGVVMYKPVSDPEIKEQLVNDVVEGLEHHLYKRWYGMDDNGVNYVKGAKNPLNKSIADELMRMYLGKTAKQIKEELMRKDEISKDDIAGIIKKATESHAKYIQPTLLEDLKPEHVDHVKEWISNQVQQHTLDKKQYDTSHVADLNSALELYLTLVQKHSHLYNRNNREQPQEGGQ